MGRFYKQKPQAGKPLALRGMADGHVAIEYALETMDVLGGNVQWNHGTPTIVPNGSGLDLKALSVYHFEVLQGTGVTVKVRGGWWSYYVGDARVQVDLDDGDSGTITSFDDFTEDITASAAAGVVYLELDISSVTPTLTAKFASDAAWAALVDAEDIMRKLIASTTLVSGVPVIAQDWRGGNILTDKGELPAGVEDDLLIHNGTDWVPLSKPAGPAVMVYDASSGVRWQVVDTKYKGIFRNTADQMVDDYVRRN